MFVFQKEQVAYVKKYLKIIFKHFRLFYNLDCLKNPTCYLINYNEQGRSNINAQKSTLFESIFLIVKSTVNRITQGFLENKLNNNYEIFYLENECFGIEHELIELFQKFNDDYRYLTFQTSKIHFDFCQMKTKKNYFDLAFISKEPSFFESFLNNRKISVLYKLNFIGQMIQYNLTAFAQSQNLRIIFINCSNSDSIDSLSTKLSRKKYRIFEDSHMYFLTKTSENKSAEKCKAITVQSPEIFAERVSCVYILQFRDDFEERFGYFVTKTILCGNLFVCHSRFSFDDSNQLTHLLVNKCEQFRRAQPSSKFTVIFLEKCPTTPNPRIDTVFSKLRTSASEVNLNQPFLHFECS